VRHRTLAWSGYLNMPLSVALLHDAAVRKVGPGAVDLIIDDLWPLPGLIRLQELQTHSGYK